MIYFTARNFEVDRSWIKLLAIIGKGQFGDVHRGVYSSPVSCFMVSYYWLIEHL